MAKAAWSPLNGKQNPPKWDRKGTERGLKGAQAYRENSQKRDFSKPDSENSFSENATWAEAELFIFGPCFSPMALYARAQSTLFALFPGPFTNVKTFTNAHARTQNNQVRRETKQSSPTRNKTINRASSTKHFPPLRFAPLKQKLRKPNSRRPRKRNSDTKI